MSVPAPIQATSSAAYQMGGYNLFIIVVADPAGASRCGWCCASRASGLIARGAMQSAEVASSLGYNPRKVYMVTFTVGAALSGLAGGVLAPLTGLLPSSGSPTSPRRSSP